MLYFRSINRFILISLALLGLSVSSVNAAVMSADYRVSGDGSITIDTVSGYEWLDLTLSTGRSFNDVSNEFGAGGDFEGWRYASPSEVGDFFSSAGGAGTYTGAQGTNVEWITRLMSLWGITGQTSDTNFSDAINTDPIFNQDRSLSRLQDLVPDDGVDLAYLQFQGWPNTEVAPTVGSALVRVSTVPVPQVPVPAAIWLFGTALIGFVGMSRRRKVA